MDSKDSSKARSKESKKNIRIAREYAKEQKEQLLNKGGWSVLPNVVFKEVIPRIISDVYDKAYAGAKRKPNVQDIAFLYSILLSYANTDDKNDYEGASWVSTDKLAKLMRISRNRIAALSNILEANGLIKTVDFYEQIKRRKLYFVIHITKVSEDGYVVNAEGEKIEPSIEVYRALTHQNKES